MFATSSSVRFIEIIDWHESFYVWRWKFLYAISERARDIRMYESKTTHHRGIEHRMLSKILRIKRIDVAWYERRIARRMERTPRKVEVLLIFSLSRSMKPRFLPMLRWSFSFLKNGHTFRGECTTLVIIRGRLESVSINRPRARGEPNVIRTAACVTSFLARVRTLQTKSHTSPSVRQYFH